MVPIRCGQLVVQPKAAGTRGTRIDLPILHLPQLIGLAMGIEPRELGMERRIISPEKALEKVGLRT